MSAQIKLRRDTAANWASVNPILSSGEPGLETDTLKVKYGDGSTAWNLLSYPTVTFPSTISNATTATNLAGGAANQVAFQTAAGTTSFIPAPTQIGYLQWTGTGFAWANSVVAASQLNGTNLATNVVNSSLTSVGTLTSLTVAGATAITSGTQSSSSLTGALVVTGGIGASGNINTAGNINITSATASTNYSTGALVVTGGVGISGNTYSNGSLGLAGTLSLSNTTATHYISSTTASTSSATGALVVSGGVGIAGNTYIQGNLVVQGTITDNTGATINGNLSVTGTETLGGLNIKSLAVAMAAALQ